MAENIIWLTGATLVTPTGLRQGAVAVHQGRIAAIRKSAPRSGRRLDLRGRTLAPGFIDLHVWGEPSVVARAAVKAGTTSFLTAVGPQSPELLVNRLVQLNEQLGWGLGAGPATLAPQFLAHSPIFVARPGGSAKLCGGGWGEKGARCLGVHLEGPFLNPLKAGALASRWLRPPTSGELRQLVHHADGQLKLVTMAPEMPRALETIRWCARHGVVVSLGHTDADAAIAQRAIRAGASAVTHVFNGMRSLHHRDPGLLGEALTDDRLMAMVILDGVHVDPRAFQLLWRCKGARGIVLTTDSIRHQEHPHVARGGAFYTSKGILAGSRLTMIRAVQNAVKFGKALLVDAVRMASANPAKLLGLDNDVGSLAVGQRADLVSFDTHYRVSLTLVDGRVVYER